MNYLIENVDYQQNIEKIGINVEDFVNENPILLPMLLAAPAIIKKYIPDATFELSHNTDFEEGNSTLYLTIFTDLLRLERLQAENSLIKDLSFRVFIRDKEVFSIFTFNIENRYQQF